MTDAGADLKQSSTDQAQRKAEIAAALESARAKTLWLLEAVPEAFLKVRVHDFYSPVGWHFGHIGMTEEFWVQTQALQRPCRDAALSFLFANLPENPKDNRVHLPSREEIVAYLAATRRQTLQALEATDLASDNPLITDGYAWEFAYQHECQHQETIAELLQLIHTEGHFPDVRAAPFSPAAQLTEMVSLSGGAFLMGSDDRHGYDNEKRAHRVEVAPFELDRTPVTSAQWLAFMADGGYSNHRLWHDAGYFDWALPNRITGPEYWRRAQGDAGAYFYVGPTGPRPIDPQEPVCGISWYEADAYARWAGKRLPTEAEWEFAAAYDPADGRSRRYPWGDAAPEPRRAAFGLSAWQPAPVGTHPDGASALGLLDMAGGVWEWTASPFLPYPGFAAFPYDGYSQDHMDGHHLGCRGGSWATSAPILRCSFRNWYVPTYRQGFLGVRCAR
jgi:iron(II)-dependent oxidoreductase